MQKKIIILCTVILIVVMEALFALIGALMPGPFTGTVTEGDKRCRKKSSFYAR